MDPAYYEDYFAYEERHWWFVARREVLRSLLDPVLGESPSGRRVLDVGCGPGGMLGLLSRYGAVEGLDTEEQAVELCHRRGFAEVERFDGGSLPRPDGAYDLVTAFDVLEHVPDDRALARELHRVVRPGGTVAVTVPAFQSLWGQQDVISHHFRRYHRAQLREVLAFAGLEVGRATYFNTLLFPAVAAVRLAQRVRPPAEVRSDCEVGPSEGPANEALRRVFASEARLLREHDLPFGVSLFAVATRPAD